MDSPSWMDVVKASCSSCFPCFPSSSSQENLAGYSRRAPPQSLASLLADPESDVDALSLHSNINGRGGRRVLKKKKKAKNITLFGLNLFGASSSKGPIHLPDEEDGNTTDTTNTRSRRTSQSSGFDSDAAQIDPAQLSASDLARRAAEAQEQAAAEAQAKAERKRLRRERREQKRLAAELALQQGQGGAEEFEGFQGSGGGAFVTRAPQSSDYPAMPSFTSRSSDNVEDDEDGQDGADFDGNLYLPNQRRTTGGTQSGGTSSVSGSSYSNPLPRPSAQGHHTRKSISTRSGTTQDSVSLPSPTSPGLVLPPTPKGDFPSAGLGSGFGLGMRPGFGVQRSPRDGTFLASRGDEDDTQDAD